MLSTSYQTPHVPDREELAHHVIGAAIEVHRILGPGLKESTYENAMCEELRQRRIPFDQQYAFDIIYKKVRVGRHQLDLLVGKKLIVELKSVERLAGLHRSQLLTYLKASRLQLGLLINFNELVLRNGIRRIIYQPPEAVR
jgi:GxxExxY protein